VSTAAETVAPVVSAVAETAAPVVATVAETASSVVESVATIVDDSVTPVAGTAVPVVTRVTGSAARMGTQASTLPPRSTIGEPVAPVSQLQPSTPAPSAHVDQVRAGGPAVQGEAGGAPPVRPALAGNGAAQATAPVSGMPATIAAFEPPAPAAVAAPLATTAAAQTRASAPAPSRGPLPRGFGLAVLGGLLAVGVALASTSSAGTGGHSPSSPTAVTTRPDRLVAPALRWRLRALAERVRPAPLVFPLELPG